MNSFRFSIIKIISFSIATFGGFIAGYSGVYQNIFIFIMGLMIAFSGIFIGAYFLDEIVSKTKMKGSLE